MTINQIKVSHNSIKCGLNPENKLKANTDTDIKKTAMTLFNNVEKKRLYSETNSSDQRENDLKKAKSEKSFESDFFQEDRSLFTDEQFEKTCQESSWLQDEGWKTSSPEASYNPIDTSFDLLSLPPLPPLSKPDSLALLSLSPIDAIQELEKLETSIPSKYPNKNDDLYFHTAVIRDILDTKDLFESKFTTILTGELESHLIPPNASDELRANLKTARNINNCVKKLVPFTNNFLQRAQIFSEDHYDINYAIIIDNTLDLLREGTYHLNPMQYTEKILSFKTGNCLELSLVGLFQGENVIRVKIMGGDHYFLIVGYKLKNLDNKNLDLEDLMRNRNAVICDPWTESYYPLFMLKEYLFDFILGWVNLNGMNHTQVKAFDSSKQSLSIVDEVD
jgi:hypothetical protein